MNQKRYHISHDETTDVVVGVDVLSSLDSILKAEKYSKCMILCTDTTKELFIKTVEDSLNKLKILVSEFVIADGEEGKKEETLLSVLEEMANQQLDRKSALIALGGGALGDVATLAAGLYFRGIDCVQIPTTLLSQVDASIGGKGAVNLGQHKNTIGIFKQPRYIIIDINLAKSLPKDQLVSGAGEIAKYAIAMDKNLFDKLYSLEKIDNIIDENIIATCAMLKMEIVQKDPKEQNVRATLNFGHTFGHAIELTTQLPHGQAIAIGMAFAIKLSVYRELLPQEEADKAISLLQKLELPITIDGVDKKAILDLMHKDKKAVGGKIKFVLLEEIGKVKIGQEVEDALVQKTLSEVIV